MKFLSGLKKLKFVRKLQLGFLLIAFVSAAIALSDAVQMSNFKSTSESLFTDYIEPRAKIEHLQRNYNEIQGMMLKFSMDVFADQFESNYQKFGELKSSFTTDLEELSNQENLNEEVKLKLQSISEIWKNYNNNVADAILSAAATQSYEMAAIISVTSGEEVGNMLDGEFKAIIELLNQNAQSTKDEINSTVQASITYIIIGMIFGTLIFLASTFIVAPAITKPINKLKDALTEFTLGNFDTEIGVNSQDEIGELATKMRQLRETQNEKIIAAEKIASGSLEKVKEASSKDKLAQSFNSEVETINELLQEAKKLIDANQRGDLSVRGNVDKFSGGWKELILGINSILDSVIVPIKEASSVLETLSKGDFRSRMTGDYKGDYDVIKQSVNTLIASMNHLIGEVAKSSNELSNAASEISASTEEMAVGANEQNNQTSEVAASVEQMTKTILENTRNANLAAESAKAAGTEAVQGGDVVVKTIDGIKRIAEVVNKSSATIEELGKSSNEIGEIVKVINDIAEQTNLLALNAAIEAARAGEQGRGFAVVADEVRKLAERTTKATKEIEEMIKQIQRVSSEAVSSILEGKNEVDKGKELASQAGDALSKIINQSEKVSEIIAQLAVASEEQASTSEQISRNVETISNVTQQSVQGTHLISQSAEGLSNLTHNLQALINQFKLDLELSKDHSHLSVRKNGKLITS
ncbi:MAG: hypothetical protein CMF23_01860 [Ignavibacteriae bacterium]|jgi:methyl-accepting chemotaxis protein|nr:hypothetical protein [Ignavibacteriota bacterium]